MNIEKKLAPFVNWFASRPRTSGYLIFVVLSLLVILISCQRYRILKKDQKIKMDIVLNDIHQNIEQSLKNCQVSIVSLAYTINDEGIPQNFDEAAKQVAESNKVISSVQLAPGGIIKYVYPMKGNEASLNLNVLDTYNLQQLNTKLIKNKTFYFNGPLQLKQGGIGIVGYFPVYKENIFWGFSTAVIKLENLLKITKSNLIDKSKYEFQFSNTNPITHKKEFYFSSKIDSSKNNYVSKKITNSDWSIYLVEKKSFGTYLLLLCQGILGLISAFILGVFTTKLVKNPEKFKILLNDQKIKILKNELKFKTVFEQSTLGFAFVDAHSGNFIEVNKKYCSILGYTPDEIIDKNFAFFTHPDDISDNIDHLKKLNEGIIKEYSAEKRYLTKSGDTIWVNLTVSPLWTSNEKPTINFTLIKDITKIKETQLLIKNNETHFKSLIDTVDGIVWEFDLERMVFTFISEKVESLLGYSVQEYLESPTFWEDHIHPEDREFVLNSSSILTKKYTSHDYKYRIIAKNGEIIWIRDIVNFVFENGKPILSRGLMIDITDMQEAEKKLTISLDLITEQNKRLLNFSHIVSHNLRSHTSNIESIITLIESAESDDERKEMMQLLKSVSNSLDETMNHLNEVVNINTNINLVAKPLNLNNYINRTRDILSSQIQLNEASFIINVPDDALINYNSAYLESILHNLISNAIRYRHHQRKPIITIKLHKENEKYVIEVSDNGIGIDLKRHADKIFGMYKTFHNNSDARGIGLFITKNQIDAMGGAISIESKLNEGTTFKIHVN